MGQNGFLRVMFALITLQINNGFTNKLPFQGPWDEENLPRSSSHLERVFETDFGFLGLVFGAKWVFARDVCVNNCSD